MRLMEKAYRKENWCELVQITPEDAAEVLEQNTTNRDIGKRLVGQMASDMVGGRWKTNGDSIKFARNGRLVDGQHRLSAVVDSGETLETFACGGLDPEIFDTLDIGKKRTLTDMMKIADVKHYTAAAAATRWLIKLDKDPVKHRVIGMKEPAQLEYYFEIADEVQSACLQYSRLRITDAGMKTRREGGGATLARIACPQGLAIALMVRFNRIDEERSHRFFELWNDASMRPDLVGTSLLAVLADQLSERMAQCARAGGRFHDSDRLVMIVTAWNHWIRGEKLRATTLAKINVQLKQTQWPGILGKKAEQLDFDEETPETRSAAP